MRRRASNNKGLEESEESDSAQKASEDELSSEVQEDESEYTLRTAKNASTRAGNQRAYNKKDQKDKKSNPKKAQHREGESQENDSFEEISQSLQNESDENESQEQQNHSSSGNACKFQRFIRERIIPRQGLIEVQDIGIQVDLTFQRQNIKIIAIREENDMELIYVEEFGHLRSYHRQYMEENHIQSLIQYYERISRCNIGVPFQFLEQESQPQE